MYTSLEKSPLYMHVFILYLVLHIREEVATSILIPVLYAPLYTLWYVLRRSFVLQAVTSNNRNILTVNT